MPDQDSKASKSETLLVACDSLDIQKRYNVNDKRLRTDAEDGFDYYHFSMFFKDIEDVYQNAKNTIQQAEQKSTKTLSEKGTVGDPSTNSLQLRAMYNGGAYNTVAGIERAAEAVLNFKISEDFIAYLATQRAKELGLQVTFNDAENRYEGEDDKTRYIFNYLRTITEKIRNEIQMKALPSGTNSLSRGPIMVLKGPKALCRFASSILSNYIGSSSSSATRGARVLYTVGKYAHTEKPNPSLTEFTQRRDKSQDTRTSTALASAGIKTTATVKAAMRHNLRVVGTIGHSAIVEKREGETPYQSELRHFRTQLRSDHIPNTFLIDTYTNAQGLYNVMQASVLQLLEGAKAFTVDLIRTDSGDLVEVAWDIYDTLKAMRWALNVIAHSNERADKRPSEDDIFKALELVRVYLPKEKRSELEDPKILGNLQQFLQEMGNPFEQTKIFATNGLSPEKIVAAQERSLKEHYDYLPIDFYAVGTYFTADVPKGCVYKTNAVNSRPVMKVAGELGKKLDTATANKVSIPVVDPDILRLYGPDGKVLYDVIVDVSHLNKDIQKAISNHRKELDELGLYPLETIQKKYTFDEDNALYGKIIAAFFPEGVLSVPGEDNQDGGEDQKLEGNLGKKDILPSLKELQVSKIEFMMRPISNTTGLPEGTPLRNIEQNKLAVDFGKIGDRSIAERNNFPQKFMALTAEPHPMVMNCQLAAVMEELHHQTVNPKVLKNIEKAGELISKMREQRKAETPNAHPYP